VNDDKIMGLILQSVWKWLMKIFRKKQEKPLGVLGRSKHERISKKSNQITSDEYAIVYQATKEVEVWVKT